MGGFIQPGTQCLFMYSRMQLQRVFLVESILFSFNLDCVASEPTRAALHHLAARLVAGEYSLKAGA